MKPVTLEGLAAMLRVHFYIVTASTTGLEARSAIEHAFNEMVAPTVAIGVTVEMDSFHELMVPNLLQLIRFATI